MDDPDKLHPSEWKIISIVFLMLITTFAFLNDNSMTPTGKVTSVVNVTRGAMEECDFEVYEGMNLISYHCINGFAPIQLLFANITESIDYAYSYFETDIDPWKVYNPNLPSYVVQDLNLIEDRRGLWIFMVQNESMYYNGTRSLRTSMDLKEGWNLIGYPTLNDETIDDALSTIEGDYNIAIAYQNPDDTWQTGGPEGDGSLEYITKDRGYWIYMNKDSTLSLI